MSSSMRENKRSSLGRQPQNWMLGTKAMAAMLLGAGLAAHEGRGETVLFSDTFNVTANSYNVNHQNTNGRQSGGTLGGLNYTEAGADWGSQVGNDANPNALLLAGNNSTVCVSPDHNFIENPGTGSVSFIRFKVDPVLWNSPNQDPLNWVGLTLGTSYSNRNTNIGATDGFAILFRGNGGYYAWNKTVAISQGTYTDDTNGFHTVEARIAGPVDGNPWDGTNGTAIALFTDGKAAPFFCYRIPGVGYTNNWVTLQGFGAAGGVTTHGVDDLQIGTNAVTVATNLALKVDFQHTTTAAAPETQVGFFDFNQNDAGSATYPTAAGSVTVALSGLDTVLGGFYNRGGVANSGSLTYAGVYKDFAFKNGASPQSLTLTLSGAGILPRERYRLTFYSYDDSVASIHSVSFSGTSGTTGSAGPLTYTCGQDPSSNSAYSVTGYFNADASGKLTISAVDNYLNGTPQNDGIRLNAFEIVADPAPKGTLIRVF